MTEHGQGAAYVKNIKANPRVRVKVGRRWRTGTAHLMPEDDAPKRFDKMPRMNAMGVRVMGTEFLTVRIDLEPEN